MDERIELHVPPILSRIQSDLEGIYRLERILDIDDFVLPKSSIDAPLDRLEQVLVAGAPDDLSMSLILDDSLLSPDTQWNLDRFCVATEGVSHVLYLASTAQRGQRVSAFELELQAEIDKFLVLVTAVGMECRLALQRLFARAHFRSTVTDNLELERYRRAHRTAWAFCKRIGASLPKQHGLEQRVERMLREVREIYRMRGISKLERLSGYRPVGGR